MPRPLVFELNQIALGNSVLRRPAYQVFIYDVRSTTDTIRDIVVGNILNPTTGPLEITNVTMTARLIEAAGAYFSGGIATPELTLQIVDPNGRFDPLLVASDPTIEGRFFRAGNVIRIIEGDVQVDEAFWPRTFTGRIFGQVGYDRNSTTRQSELTVRAVGREADYTQYNRTSNEFVIGTSYLTMATTVATEEMGLDFGELDFPSFGSSLVPHKSIQLVDETPMVMLSRIGFIDSLLPFFTGEGKLSMTADRATGAPARVYAARHHVLSITRPVADVQPPNSVCVVGLDAELSKAVLPHQALAQMQLTTGFFDKSVKEKVYWRDDRTLFAENVRLKVLNSVNGGLSGLGGGESITPILSGDPDKLGEVGAILEAETGHAPWIVVFLLVVYIVLAAIPDSVTLVATIPVGRIIQAIAMGAAMFVMSKLGRGSYTFEGDPFEYVFAEIRHCAVVSGTPAFEGRNELVLENHLVSTQIQAKDIAFQQLIRAQAEKAPRTIIMIHDLGMVPGDIIEFFDTNELYLVASIDRILSRDPSRTVATVQCFDITSTVHVGT